MRHLRWVALVALVALALIPYLGAVHNPLLYDDRALLDNPWLVHEAGPVSVFRHDYFHGTKHADWGLYRPATVLSLAWNLRAAPTKEGIRSVNFAAHAVATLALFWMLGAISHVRKGSVPERRGLSPSAWIGAALFAVHPLGSEAVLWAVGRAEIFAAMLGIAAFVLFVRLHGERGLGGRRIALSLAAFLAALCFKESAATWLVIAAAWVALRSREDRPPARIVAARAACYVAAFAAYCSLRASAVGWGHHDASFIDNPLAGADAATRVVNAVLLFARYVAKMLWPQTLSVEYGFDQIPVVPWLPWGALGALVIATGVVAAVVALHRKGHAAAAFLTAFVPSAFAVTGNLAFPIGTIFAERLAYLPLAGMCGLAGLALAAIPKSLWRAVAVGVLLAACGARSLARGGDYRDVATLTEATAEASPRAVKALLNAGRVRLRQEHAVLALPLLERAVAIWPDYARAWALLAEAYEASGDPARAEDARRRTNEAASRATAGDEPL
jgi:tetratricopeptide (TPR) repeat protein